MNVKLMEKRKCYAVAWFLSEDNKKHMRNAAEECGFEIAFYDNSAEADGKVADGEVLYCGSDVELLAQMPKLKWCHTAFAGVGGLAASGVFDSGDVLLTNSSGAYGRAISEYIIMSALMLVKRMPDYRIMTDKRDWRQGLASRSVAGSNVVIIGTGDIGKNAAARFKALGAKKVTGFNRSGHEAEGFDSVYGMDEFDRLFSDRSFAGSVDILVMCVPGTKESEHLLNAGRIALLSERTYLINVGRGWTVDQSKLVEALNGNRIAGAALDVVYPEPLPADDPLWTAKNCIVTPHMSGDMSLPYTVDRTVEMFCENLRRFTGGEELIKLIDVQKGY